MRLLEPGRYALGACAAGVLLAGCSAPQSPMTTPAAMHQFALFRPIATHPDPGRSWIARSASAQDLLYISDGGANDVLVYSYPAGSMTGKLTNLGQPGGVCSDSAGDVWVVESAKSKIVKFAHGGTKPIATRIDKNADDLLGCSVDPTTGNLAVTDLGGPAGGGGVWIYLSGKGSAKKYKDSNLASAYFCGYDDAGNLFVDGLDSSENFELAELPSGSATLQTIALNQSVGFPGGIQWDGQYVAIGDQYYDNQHKSAIYQVSVSGSSATVEGTTVLGGSCDALQFVISSAGSHKKSRQQANTAIAPDVCEGSVAFYNYPSGGPPTNTLTGFQYPVAAAVSVAQ